MEQTVKIKKDTQVGFGWLAIDGLSNYSRPKEPVYTGTIREVVDARMNDATYRQALNSSLFIVAEWFVNIAGEWLPIKTDVNGRSIYDVYQGKVKSVSVIVER